LDAADCRVLAKTNLFRKIGKKDFLRQRAPDQRVLVGIIISFRDSCPYEYHYSRAIEKASEVVLGIAFRASREIASREWKERRFLAEKSLLRKTLWHLPGK